MSAVPTQDEYLAAIATATRRMHSCALEAGGSAIVPACPNWRVRHLIAHMGITHRWARAQITDAVASGNPQQAVPRFQTNDEVFAAVHVYDLPAWLLDGCSDLMNTLQDASPDVRAWTFITTDRSPLEFWTRRQAHETVIHAVDAVGAVLERVPSVDDVLDGALGSVLTTDFAVDGLDELLTRFAPRGRSKLWDGSPLTIVVAADDTDAAWTLSVAEDALAVRAGDCGDADARWTGRAAALYLGLWNRGDDIKVIGDSTTLANWHGRHRIR